MKPGAIGRPTVAAGKTGQDSGRPISGPCKFSLDSPLAALKAAGTRSYETVY
jgi:hypothetical protein